MPAPPGPLSRSWDGRPERAGPGGSPSLTSPFIAEGKKRCLWYGHRVVSDASREDSPRPDGKVSAKSARAGVGGLIRGFVQHPIIVSRVVMTKVKSDPVRVAQAAAESLPPVSAPSWARSPGRWPAGPGARSASSACGCSRGRGTRPRSTGTRAGSPQAAAVLEAHTKYPFVKRRAAYYRGELAAISPTRSRRSPRWPSRTGWPGGSCTA